MTLSDLEENILKSAYLLFRKGKPSIEKELFKALPIKCKKSIFLDSLKHLKELRFINDNELTVYGLSHCINFEVD